MIHKPFHSPLGFAITSRIKNRSDQALQIVSNSNKSLQIASNCYKSFQLYGGDFRVVRSLDPCSKSPGFETTFRPVTKCEERISQLSVIPAKKGKRSHEVWSHREEGPRSHCSISLPIQWALSTSTINYQLSTTRNDNLWSFLAAYLLSLLHSLITQDKLTIQ